MKVRKINNFLIVMVVILLTIGVVNAQTFVSGEDSTSLIIQGQVHKTPEKFIPVMTARVEWYRDLNEKPMYSFDLSDGAKHKCFGFGFMKITPAIAGVNPVSTQLSIADGTVFTQKNVYMDDIRDLEKDPNQMPSLIINLAEVPNDFYIYLNHVNEIENNWSMPVLFFLTVTTHENACFSKVFYMHLSKPDGGENYRTWSFEKLYCYFAGASLSGKYVGKADIANTDVLNVVGYYKALKIARQNDPDYNELYPELTPISLTEKDLMKEDILDVGGQKVLIPRLMPEWMMESFLVLDEKVEKIENDKIVATEYLKVAKTGHFYFLTTQPIETNVLVVKNGKEQKYLVTKDMWVQTDVYSGQERIEKIYFLDATIYGITDSGVENIIQIVDAVPAPNVKYVEQVSENKFRHDGSKSQLLPIY